MEKSPNIATPTISVFLFVEGLLATGCAHPRETTRVRDVERSERSIAIHGASSPIAIDGAGADGSDEGRPCLFNNIFVRKIKPYSASRLGQ